MKTICTIIATALLLTGTGLAQLPSPPPEAVQRGQQLKALTAANDPVVAFILRVNKRAVESLNGQPGDLRKAMYEAYVKESNLYIDQESAKTTR